MKYKIGTIMIFMLLASSTYMSISVGDQIFLENNLVGFNGSIKDVTIGESFRFDIYGDICWEIDTIAADNLSYLPAGVINYSNCDRGLLFPDYEFYETMFKKPSPVNIHNDMGWCRPFVWSVGNDGVVNNTNDSAFNISWYANNVGTATVVVTKGGTARGGNDYGTTKLTGIVNVHPVEPNNLSTLYNGSKSIDISWIKGNGALKTIICGSVLDFPSSPYEETVIYNGTGSSCSYDVIEEEIWYFSIWSYGGDLYSIAYNTCVAYPMNHPPVANDDYVFLVEDSLNFQIDVLVDDSDPNNDNINITNCSQPSNGSVFFNDDYVFYTPLLNFNGEDKFNYSIEDGNGGFDSAIVYLNVTAVNDPPMVSDIPDQTVGEGEEFIAINLDDYVVDIDDSIDDLNWSYSGTKELNISIVDHIINITIIDPDWNGQEIITFTVTDTGGLSDSNNAIFTVIGENDPPIVSDILDQTVDEGDSFVTIDLDEYVEDTEDPDEDIVWTYSGNTDLIVDIVDRVATVGIPDVDWFGSETISFKATDTNDLFDIDEVNFVVNPINDPPVVGDIPNQEIDEGDSFSTINLDDYVYDVDDLDENIIWFYNGNVELGVSIVNHIATISIPYSDWYGSENITFRATDAGRLWDEDYANFIVKSVNDPPIVADIPDQTIFEGEEFSAINLDDYVYDAEDQDEDINWSYSGDDELIVDINNRIVTINIIKPLWNGSETITFTAEDTDGFTGSNEVIFTVVPEKKYSLNVNSEGEGSVKKEPDQILYSWGEVVELTAIADSDWSFSQWDGDIIGDVNPITFIIKNNMNIMAIFTENPPDDTEDDEEEDTEDDETEDPTITNQKPIANTSAGEPYIGFIDEEITFDGSESYDPDGYITSWFWNFGDGTTSDEEIITHIYLNPGEYSVGLTVTDNEDAKNTHITKATVIQPNRPPFKPYLEGPRNGSINIYYNFSAQSFDLDNDSIRYFFDWGDGSIENVTDYMENNTIVFISHSWLKADVYHIESYVEDENNATSDVAEIMILIDVDILFIDDVINGYLIDYKLDDIFDVFHNNATGNNTLVEYQNDGTILIDSDGDDEWDYIFDPETGLLIIFNKEDGDIVESINFLLISIFILAIAALIIILILYKKDIL